MLINLAVAEDNSFALEALKRKLACDKAIRIKLVAPNGRYLVDHMVGTRVDLVLMDIEMPLMNGIEATIAIKAAYPQVKILVLTTFDDDDKVFDSIKAGASGYLLKEIGAEQLSQAIREVLRDGAPMSPSIALKVLHMVRNQAALTNRAPKPADLGLTKREIELLEQLKNGLTYRQVADNLCISFGTVRKHIDNIYHKLHVNNRTDALRKLGGDR